MVSNESANFVSASSRVASPGGAGELGTSTTPASPLSPGADAWRAVTASRGGGPAPSRPRSCPTRRRQRPRPSHLPPASSASTGPSQLAPTDLLPPPLCSTLAKLRLRSIAPPALVALALVACLVLLRAGTTSAPPPSSILAKNSAHAAQHPNFDFDAHIEQHAAPGKVLGEDDDETAAGEVADEDEAGSAEDAADEGEGEGEDEADDADGELPAPRPGTTLAPPFLPFTCDDCSSASARHPSAPVCAKYRGTFPSSSTSSASSSSAHPSPHHSGLHPDILDHSVLFAGTGAEVRRVLKRAMRSSLWAAKRAREGTEDDVQRAEGEEPFRILVLGGSGASSLSRSLRRHVKGSGC